MGKNFTVKTEVNISKEIKTIIKSGNYEKVIFEIMNSSEKMFASKYIHNEEQSHGECDFVDVVSGEKYDVKLPFSKTQGELLGSNNCDYEAWIKSMLDESEEFSNIPENRGKIKAEELTLYKIVSERLTTVKQDENLILFFPFPIVACDVPGSVLLQFTSNILTVVFDALEKNGIVNNRQIFAIYPCMDNHLAIRFLNKRTCEYVSDEPLKKYIDYNICLELE